MIQPHRAAARTVPFVPRHAARDTLPSRAAVPPLRRRTGGRHRRAELSAAQLTFRDPGQPTDDQLERMLARLRSL